MEKRFWEVTVWNSTKKLEQFHVPIGQITAEKLQELLRVLTAKHSLTDVEVERLICEKLAPTPCVSGKSVLPPTRQYTPAEVEKYLQASGADAVFIIALVADQSDTRYFGTITTSSASASATSSGSINFYGNTAFWNGAAYGSASGQSVSMPMYGYSRVAFGQLGLFDRPTGNVAWRGEIRVEGRGLLNVTDSAFISSATSKIARELKAAGLVN